MTAQEHTTPAGRRWVRRPDVTDGREFWSCKDAVWRVFETWDRGVFRVVGLSGGPLPFAHSTATDAMDAVDMLPTGKIRGLPTAEERARHFAEVGAALRDGGLLPPKVTP